MSSGDNEEDYKQSPRQIDDDDHHGNNNNNNNNKEEDDRVPMDFELIESVEWGPRRGEDGYDTDQELAPRPRRKPPQEPCGCLPPDQDGALACLDDSCVLYACREECRSNCEAGPLCGNKRIQKREFCQTEVFDAGRKGRGLRLARNADPVGKGDLIGEYTGRAVRAAALPRLFRRYQLDRQLYIMSLGMVDGCAKEALQVFLDAREKGGIARFINHSCRPNCQVELWNVKGVPRAAIIATTDIAHGEELTFDYQWERKRGRAPTVCHCGMPECRGTLELPKSLEEVDMLREFEGHWEQYTESTPPDKTLINRTVQIYSESHKEYFLGEVTDYDGVKGLHKILYRHGEKNDVDEVWEDLKKEDFMILNERIDKEHFSIGRKSVGRRRPSPTSSLLAAVTTSDRMMKPGHAMTKNYLYVQTHIKDGLKMHRLLERCQRTCNVQIAVQQFSRPPLPPDMEDPDDIEKHAALDRSLDGTVWKLTISGSDIPRALNILEKNVTYVEKKQAAAEEASAAQNTVKLEYSISGATDISGTSVLSSELPAPGSEIIFPRSIADHVKRRLPSVQGKCRAVNIMFAASDSKSKQFSRILLDGPLVSDVNAAKEHLWKFLVNLCEELKTPMAAKGIPRDLCFFGTVLSQQELQLLVDSSTQSQQQSSARNRKRPILPYDAAENLNESGLIRSFANTYHCTVWIQAQEDQGRVDSSNRLVNEATPDSFRRVYFGCHPSEVTKLGMALQTRASEIARGVKFLHLGGDRVFIKLMLKNGGQFFEFVRQVTGSNVSIDLMTGDHLRIDGRESANNVVLDEKVRSLSVSQRTDLAMEVIRLQVEFFRDECIRQQPWIFGRDWSLCSFVVDDLAAISTVSVGLLDRKSASSCGIEVAETVANLQLPPQVAGHAVVILYRFVCSKPFFSSQIKLREAVLACIFLANKAQKDTKWKRPEVVLEAGYNVFYPGSQFDAASEEAVVLGERVVAAEKEILESLQYDVFWRGTDWIHAAILGGGVMDEKRISLAFGFVFSGPVLCAGPELWLKYGIEYIFAAAAAVLRDDFTNVIQTLSLLPLKVAQAVELILKNVKHGRQSNGAEPFASLLPTDKAAIEKAASEISDKCIAIMAPGTELPPVLPASEAEQRYRIIGQQSRCCRRICGIPSGLLKECMSSVLDKIALESSCALYIHCTESDSLDLILDGCWRSIAVAENLMRTKFSNKMTMAPAFDVTSENLPERLSERSKEYPGLLKASDIQIGCGWIGCSLGSALDSMHSLHVGGKCCVAAKVGASILRESGLRWWIPSKYFSSTSANFGEMFLMNDVSQRVDHLRDIAKTFEGTGDDFPLLNSLGDPMDLKENFLPVSVQRWPSEKIEKKESASAAAKSKKAKSAAMSIGFSAAALQEIQMFKKLHCAIPTPQGHPNFIVPVCLAVPSGNGRISDQASNGTKTTMRTKVDPIISLFQSSDEKTESHEKRGDVLGNACIVFNPSPFVLHHFMSRKMRYSDGLSISPPILAAWFHDCLSVLVHCHANNILLRTVQSEQFVVDQCGVINQQAIVLGS
jgi:histone-lysine N-methyltransferase SETD2